MGTTTTTTNATARTLSWSSVRLAARLCDCGRRWSSDSGRRWMRLVWGKVMVYVYCGSALQHCLNSCWWRFLLLLGCRQIILLLVM